MSAGFLKSEASFAAICLRLARQDGVTLGFTTHDRELWIGGVPYAAAGVSPSALTQSLGTAGQVFEVRVPLASDGIRPADIEQGLWTEAGVRLFVTDWRFPGAETHSIAAGTVTAASRRIAEAAADFTVRDPMAALSDAAPLLCSPTCRASLGDRDCGVDMAGRSLRVLCTADGGNASVWADAPLERFIEGRLRVLTGPLAGLDRRVTGVEGRLTLLEPPLPPAPAFEVLLTEGCDRRIDTCAQRFSNAARFRGEPHVPGTDALLRRG